MMQGTIMIFLFVVFISPISAIKQKTWADDVAYEDLENLGASCRPMDTCSNESDVPIFYTKKKCDCDANCVLYNTCCLDSPYRSFYIRLHKRPKACVEPIGHTSTFYMVNECDSRWYGQPEIWNRCRESDIRDPYSLVPAVDRETSITYKNYFCGICNFIDSEKLTIWNMTVNKFSFINYTDAAFMDYLTFDEEERSWGHWEKYSETWQFSPVTMSVIIPDFGYVKDCMRNLIEDCDPDWRDAKVFHQCQSYMAPIIAKRNVSALVFETYRNVHCAICNFATWDPKDSCFFSGGMGGGAFGGGAGGGGFTPLSFTLLFDVNPKDGDKVGKISRCESGESYDPFFKKCRSLVCGLPGYVLKGNRCLRT